MNKKYIPIAMVLTYDLIFIVLTYLSFSDERAADGPLSLGFPYPFYFGGGYCRAACGPDIVLMGLAIDTLVFAVPTFVIMVFYEVLRRRASVD